MSQAGDMMSSTWDPWARMLAKMPEAWLHGEQRHEQQQQQQLLLLQQGRVQPVTAGRT